MLKNKFKSLDPQTQTLVMTVTALVAANVIIQVVNRTVFK